jgi:hypothetical protein
MDDSVYKLYCYNCTQAETGVRACNMLRVSIESISDPRQKGLIALDTVRISTCLDIENTMGFVTVDPRNALRDVTFHIQLMRDMHIVKQQPLRFCHSELLTISIIRDVSISECFNLVLLRL